MRRQQFIPTCYECFAAAIKAEPDFPQEARAIVLERDAKMESHFKKKAKAELTAKIRAEVEAELGSRLLPEKFAICACGRPYLVQVNPAGVCDVCTGERVNRLQEVWTKSSGSTATFTPEHLRSLHESVRTLVEETQLAVSRPASSQQAATVPELPGDVPAGLTLAEHVHVMSVAPWLRGDYEKRILHHVLRLLQLEDCGRVLRHFRPVERNQHFEWFRKKVAGQGWICLFSGFTFDLDHITEALINLDRHGAQLWVFVDHPPQLCACRERVSRARNQRHGAHG